MSGDETQALETQALETYKLVVISTAHLSEQAARDMEKRYKELPVTVAPFEEGFFVSCSRVGDSPAQVWGYLPEPHSLWECRRWAEAQGFGYLMLDRDAEQVDGLPVYEW